MVFKMSFATFVWYLEKRGRGGGVVGFGRGGGCCKFEIKVVSLGTGCIFDRRRLYPTPPPYTHSRDTGVGMETKGFGGIDGWEEVDVLLDLCHSLQPQRYSIPLVELEILIEHKLPEPRLMGV